MLGNAEAAAYLAKRLDQISDPLERGWQAEAKTGADGQHIEITRTLRGITETHYLNRKFIQTSEARQLDSAAALLQKIFVKGAVFATPNAEFAIKGPSELAVQVTALGKKGAQIARYKGLGEMNPGFISPKPL